MLSYPPLESALSPPPGTPVIALYLSSPSQPVFSGSHPYLLSSIPCLPLGLLGNCPYLKLFSPGSPVVSRAFLPVDTFDFAAPSSMEFSYPGLLRQHLTGFALSSQAGPVQCPSFPCKMWVFLEAMSLASLPSAPVSLGPHHISPLAISSLVDPRLGHLISPTHCSSLTCPPVHPSTYRHVQLSVHLFTH